MSSERLRKTLQKKLFAKNLNNCAECKVRIGTKNSRRRRMVILGKKQTPQGEMMSASGYQLCNTCAKNLEADKFHLLPNVCKDLAQADLLAFGNHAGGVQ